jgi:hypothetical protein
VRCCIATHPNHVFLPTFTDIGDPSKANMKALPARRLMSGRQLGYFDSKNEKFVLIDTVFGTHHLQFDWQGRLWTSGDGSRLGMFDPAKFDPSRPVETEAAAQTAWTQIDAATGKSAMGGGYGIVISPKDGTVWRANYPGIFGQEPLPDLSGNYIDKFDPKTRTYERCPIPLPGYGPRGIDATTDGRLWFGTGSGHLGRFDPETEQFKYWETPGPKIKSTGAETGSADFHYYIWVDQFDTLGLGRDTVILTGTNSDSLLAFNPSTEVHRHSRAVPARVVHARPRRPDRRREGRVEAKRVVGVEQHGRSDAHREAARVHQPRAVPARSAGEVM